MNGQYEIGRFVSEGWAAFKQKMAPMVVGFIVYIGVLMAANLVPFFGGLVSFAITGPMLGGLMLLALKVVDGDEPSWNGIFDGFQKFMPLFLANMMITIFTLVPVFAVVIPGVLFLGFGGMLTAGMEPSEEMAAGAGAALGGGILLLVFVAMLAYMVVYSWYLYTYFFIMEEDDDFWPAMEKSRKIWFAQPVPSTLFVLVIGLISMSGFLLLGVGALITVPLGFCAMAVAYRNVANAGTVAPPALGSVPPSAPPPPPKTTGRFDNIPAQSGDTLVIPPPLAQGAPTFVHCFVFVEKSDVNDAVAAQIVKLGAPKASGNLPDGGITPLRIDEWPHDDHDLSETIRENIRARKGDYLDSHRFHISVWKGRDKKSAKNMAVATVTTA